jgi:triacylglycerol lipase
MNLVLNHGIFGFATFHGIAYFNGVVDYLTSKFPNLRILVAQVPPTGTVEVRGTELGKQILQALQPGGLLDPNESIHIIAHSMGGLDARFLLSPDNPGNMADRIVSLTTISTPHKGSPVADLLVKLLDPLNITGEEKLLSQIIRERLSFIGIEVGGLRNLTTKEVERFNQRFRDNDGTQRFSVAGAGRNKKIFDIHLNTCGTLRLAYTLIKEVTGGADNDGLVSLDSAAWGNEPEVWFADHADEIGHDLDYGLTAGPAHFDYLTKYKTLVDRLRKI